MQRKGLAKKSNPFAAILLWVFFSVVIGGVLPIFFSFLFSSVLGQPFSLEEVVSHGELIVVTVSVVGGVFYDLYVGPHLAHGNFSVFIVVVCLTVLLGSCFVFGCLSAINTVGSNLHVSHAFVLWFSIANFSLAVSIGTFTKWMNR